MQALDKKAFPDKTASNSPPQMKELLEPKKNTATKLSEAVKNPSFRRSKSNLNLTIQKNAQSEPLVRFEDDDAMSDMSNRSLGLNR